MGGTVAAVEFGYLKQQLVESNSRRVEAIERGEQIVVGVNRFIETEASPLTDAAEAIVTVSAEAETGQIERLAAWRAARDAQGRRRGARSVAARGEERRQHHAGVDRLRQSRRHHRRMGLCAALRVRRIPRADRRRHRHAQRRRRARRHPRRGRPGVEEARPAAEISGRQARASTAIPTAPSRSRPAPATPAWTWSMTASA